MPLCPTCGHDAGEGSAFCPHDGTPLSHLGRGMAAMPRAGDTVDGRFALLERIGSGGMAVVFRARSAALDRDVALKVLYPRWAEDRKTVARFAREARAASAIDHEAVVRVYDFGFAQEGFYFLTMELLEGRPLSALKLPLTSTRAMRLLIDIASGLARAHELGVIHRDLKPENVMVLRGDGRERVKIVDFGLSKIDGGNALTGEGDVIGTPDFMAPEQWQGFPVDTRADVYAFGILAYDVLSGELPYKGETVIQLLQQHLYTDPKPLTEQKHVVPLPAGMAELVMRCMSKDPLDRPPHMGRVRDALIAIDEASRELSMEPTRIGLAPIPATTIVSMDDALLLDRRELHAEIARLRHVRRKRLTELVPKAFGGALPGAIDEVQRRIRAAEAHLEEAEQDAALAEASLDEAQKAHRLREAELRGRLVAANLELAVARHALPGEVTDLPFTADTISLDGSSWPPTDLLGEGDLDKATDVLRRAEERLADFVRAPDEAILAAEVRFEEALRTCDRAEEPLTGLYEELESGLRAAPNADHRALDDLVEIDGIVLAYRSRLDILERHTRLRAPD